jgi:hypothetical protein
MLKTPPNRFASPLGSPYTVPATHPWAAWVAPVLEEERAVLANLPINSSNIDPLTEQPAVVAPFVSPTALYWRQVASLPTPGEDSENQKIESID